LLESGDLVSDALGLDLALELDKGKQRVESEPANAGSGVEWLGDLG
jgi:hypothetical protein